MNQNTKSYTPISCQFHDHLLEKATLKEPTEILFLKEGQSVSIEGIIIDVFTLKGEEFLKMSDGEIIRLDFLISVNGIKLVDFYCHKP